MKWVVCRVNQKFLVDKIEPFMLDIAEGHRVSELSDLNPVPPGTENHSQ